MMRTLRLAITTSFVVEEPTAVGGGFVTRLNVKILASEEPEPDESFEEAPPVEVGDAKLTLVHVGAAREAGESLSDVLEMADDRLAEAHDLYFYEGDFIADFWGASGVGLLYIEQLRIHPSWKDCNIDLAVVQRLCQTIGEGCRVVALYCTSKKEAEHWFRLGFEPSVLVGCERSAYEREAGFLHMIVAYPGARVVEDFEHGFRFRILPLEDERDGGDEAEPEEAGPSSLPRAASERSPSPTLPTATAADRSAPRRRRGAPRRR